MGSATAWHLARRGRQVTLIERFGARHTLGASHGRSRNFNLTYVDPTYQAMLREAAVLWRELEGESGVSLLDLVGIANHGAGIAPDLRRGARSPRRAGVDADAGGGAGAMGRHPVRHPGGPHPGSRTAGRGGGGRDPPVRDRSTRRRGPARHPGRLDPRALRRPGRGVDPGGGVRRGHRRRHGGRVDRQAVGSERRAAEAGGHPGAAGPLRGVGPLGRLAGLQPPARAGQRPLRLLVLADLRHAHAR